MRMCESRYEDLLDVIAGRVRDSISVETSSRVVVWTTVALGAVIVWYEVKSDVTVVVGPARPSAMAIYCSTC